MNKDINYKELLRFLIIGITSTILHYGIYILLKIYLGYVVSYSISYFIALLFNFYLSSVFTFREQPTLNKFLGVIVVHLINYIIHICLLKLFVFWGLSNIWAPIPVFALAVPINYLLIRIVFKYKKK